MFAVREHEPDTAASKGRDPYEVVCGKSVVRHLIVHNGWRGLGAVPWRDTRDEAQKDLDALAKEKGWKEWGGAGG